MLCIAVTPPPSNFPISPPLIGCVCSLVHQNLDMKPRNNPTVTSNGEKNYASFIWNSKLEMIKHREEDMLKTMTSLKLEFLCKKLSK